MENFWKYYNSWKEDTMFSSITKTDDPNYQALLNPDLVSDQELWEGAKEVLKDKDDRIVMVLIERFPGIIEIKGYVGMHYICEVWRIILSSLDSPPNSKT